MLIVQGERDALGNHEEVGQYQLGAGVEVKWLPDGDHDFKPRQRSGFAQSEHLATAARWIANFSEQVRR
jgi:predicted alpha/beta-hydrolase family hydrolase